jgi:hypothetical protein
MDRNPEALEKTLMNKSWVTQALLPVPKADASQAEHTSVHRGATVKKPEQATDRAR